MEPSFLKSHVRKIECMKNIRNFKDALVFTKDALEIFPDNNNLKKMKDEISEKLDVQYMNLKGKNLIVCGINGFPKTQYLQPHEIYAAGQQDNVISCWIGVSKSKICDLNHSSLRLKVLLLNNSSDTIDFSITDDLINFSLYNGTNS